MNRKRQFDLLYDIARLLVKHGPEPFDELAEYLQHPESTGRIVEILRTYARISQSHPSSTAGTGKQRRRGKSVKELFLLLDQKDPGKAQLLRRLHDRGRLG